MSKVQAKVGTVGSGDNKVKVPVEEQKTFTVDYPIPETISDAVAAYGEEIVYTVFTAQLVVQLQSRIRALAASLDESGAVVYAKDKEIQAKIDDWKPSKGRVKLTDEEKVLKMFEGLSPEAQAEVMARISG